MKRWIIRGFFIVLLLLSAGGWLGSYLRRCEVGYRNTSYSYGSHWNDGRLILGFGDNTTFDPTLDKGWSFDFYYWNGVEVNPPFFPYFGFYTIIDSHGGVMWIPFWFATLLDTALLWLVWRKTWSKAGGGRFRWKVGPLAIGSYQSRDREGATGGQRFLVKLELFDRVRHTVAS